MDRKRHGLIQRAIVTWLNRFQDGGDVDGIAAGVYEVAMRESVTKAQHVAVRRAIRRLADQGVVQQSSYRSLLGYENWQIKEEGLHPSRRRTAT